MIRDVGTFCFFFSAGLRVLASSRRHLGTRHRHRCNQELGGTWECDIATRVHVWHFDFWLCLASRRDASPVWVTWATLHPNVVKPKGRNLGFVQLSCTFTFHFLLPSSMFAPFSFFPPKPSTSRGQNPTSRIKTLPPPHALKAKKAKVQNGALVRISNKISPLYQSRMAHSTSCM